MVLELLLRGQNVMRSLQEAPVVQCPGSGAGPCYLQVANENSFVEQLPECYWALVEGECLTMQNQMTTYPELSIRFGFYQVHKDQGSAEAIRHMMKEVHQNPANTASTNTQKLCEE